MSTTRNRKSPKNKPLRTAYNRKIDRNITRNASKQPGNSRKDNRRMFAAIWQKMQIKKFGGIKEYIRMRIAKKREGEGRMDITLYA